MDTKIPKCSLKKRKAYSRKKSRRKQRRKYNKCMNGGARVLPSEYFGKESGRYATNNDNPLNVNTLTYGKMQAVSQGTLNELGSRGPNLAPYLQKGSGILDNVVDLFTNKKEEEEKKHDVQPVDLQNNEKDISQRLDLLNEQIKEIDAQIVGAEEEAKKEKSLLATQNGGSYKNKNRKRTRRNIRKNRKNNNKRRSLRVKRRSKNNKRSRRSI